MRAAVGRVALALALGCAGTAPSQPPARPSLPSPACFADAIGSLAAPWQPRPGCDPEDAACRDACRAGEPNACFDRAIRLQHQDPNDPEVEQLFLAACKGGLAIGCTNWAAERWVVGRRTPWRCLYRVFEKSCGVGEPFGCGMMGRLLVEDGNADEDRARAQKILQQACDRYAGGSCRMLAWYIEQGRFGPPDKTRVDDLMKRACDGGDSAACGDHATAEETFHGPP